MSRSKCLPTLYLQITLPIPTKQALYDAVVQSGEAGDPGASPDTVESDVRRKVEDTVSGVDTLTSRSDQGLSVVTIQFNLATSSSVAVQDVREKVSAVRAQFRKEVSDPTISRFNPDDAPIISVAVASKTLKLRELTTLAEQVIAKRLQSVRGAGKASIAGGVKRQIEIRLKPDRLQANNIGVDQVTPYAPRTRVCPPAPSYQPALILTHCLARDQTPAE